MIGDLNGGVYSNKLTDMISYPSCACFRPIARKADNGHGSLEMRTSVASPTAKFSNPQRRMTFSWRRLCWCESFSASLSIGTVTDYNRGLHVELGVGGVETGRKRVCGKIS
jgi:hypothetical protein